MNRILVCASVLCLFGAVGCSSSSDGGAAASALNGAYQGLKNNLPEGGAAASSMGLSARAAHGDFSNTDWPVNGQPNQTGAHFIASLVDEGIDHSVLDSVRNSLMIACFLDLYGPKESGKLKVGADQIVKMKTSWGNSTCPGAKATMTELFEQAATAGGIIDAQGEIPLTITVTDISADGVYDRQIHMPVAENPQFGGVDQTMRLKIVGSSVVFSHDEEDTNNANAKYTSYINYTPSPEKIVFQHTHKGPNSERAYRFYVSDATNKAALLAYTIPQNGRKISTLLTSKPTDMTFGNLSQSYVDYNGNDDAIDAEGCINFDSGVLAVNDFGTGSCAGLTQVSASAAGDLAGTGILGTFDGYNSAAMDITNTFQVTFDETNIATVDFH